MRYFIAWLLLATWCSGASSAESDSPLFQQARAWRGKIEVRVTSDEPARGSGRETQVEIAEFTLVTKPGEWAVRHPRLRMSLIHMQASFEWRIQQKQEADGVDGMAAIKGGMKRRMHVAVDGWVDPVHGRYALRARVSPSEFAIRVTRSGVVGGRLEIFRTVLTRQAQMGRFSEVGTLDDDGRGVTGSRSFVQYVSCRDRTVYITWSLERLDPVVRGRVVDTDGRPVKGVAVRATAPGGRGMMVRSGETDDDGQFEIPCVTGFWRVFTIGRREEHKDGAMLLAGTHLDPVSVQFDDVPTLDVTVTRYRLRKLPRPDLLRRFAGDVDKYLAHLRERAPEVVLSRAEIKSAPAENK
ncbi:MAG: carboxypeptidase-like regulatory domain-containing protein [Planctomycetota bacterium]